MADMSTVLLGNGTQSIVWQINEETYRQTLETESGGPPSKPGPQVFYGSLHDILSYPCEVSCPLFPYCVNIYCITRTAR